MQAEIEYSYFDKIYNTTTLNVDSLETVDVEDVFNKYVKETYLLDNEDEQPRDFVIEGVMEAKYAR